MTDPRSRPVRRAAPSPAALPAALALAALLPLTGCATAPPPPPEEPAELVRQVPATYTATPESPPEKEVLYPLDRWWESFGDPRLTALVEEALEANPDLGAALARFDAARAQARIAGAALSPQVDASLDASRGRQNFIGFPDFGGSAPTGPDDPDAPAAPTGGERVLSTTSTSFGLGVNVAWEADLWGRLRARRSAARLQADAVETDLAAVRLSLAGQVVRTWFSLVEARAQAGLAAATVENRERVASRIRRRFEAGLRPALDLRLALADLAAARALLAQRQEQADAFGRRLETLAGSYPAGAVDSPDTLSAPPPTPPTGVPSELLARRPDLVAAEIRLEAAGYSVAAARAALFPTLRLTGSAGTRAEEIEDLFDTDFSVWNLAAGLLQPLYDGGRLRAGVDLDEARFEEAAYSLASAALTAYREVETALAADELLERRVSALEEAAEQSLEARENAEERYAAGLVDVLVVLDSERRALDAQSQLLTARARRLTQRVDLHLALGGGFGGETVP
jgi:outer membrane protein, multidrug efflux system